MDPETPQWLTKEFIGSALQNGKDYTIEICDFKINSPIAKGENYGSKIYGAFVKYRKSNDLNKLHRISLIIKAPFEGINYEHISKPNVFKKESVIYFELSKKFKIIFNGICNNNLIPEAYSSSVENVLILEDLKSKGYVVADRLNQFDYDLCVVALKGLAQFHAGSVIIHDKEPEFIENLGKEVFLKLDANHVYSVHMASNFKILANVLKNLPEFEKYSKWFDVNAEHAYELMVNSVLRDDGDFNVLNHGDFWINNILIKYDENVVPLDVKLIDFADARYVSPALDFWYFMDGSVQENVRTEKFYHLVDVYLNELNSLLGRFGSDKRLEKLDFKKSLKKHVNFRLIGNFLLLPMIVADPNEVKVMETEETFVNFESTNSGSNPMVEYYKNIKYINLLKKRLEELEKCGVITTE